MSDDTTNYYKSETPSTIELYITVNRLDPGFIQARRPRVLGWLLANQLSQQLFASLSLSLSPTRMLYLSCV